MTTMADPRVAALTQQLENLRTKRTHFESQWEDAAWRLIPAHKDTFRSRGMTPAMTPGRQNSEKSFDSTAALALQRFAAVFESLSTPQGQMWHRLVPSNRALKRNRQVRLYMDELTEILFDHRYRASAGFVGQQQKSLMGYGAYGNGYLFIDQQDDGSGLRYKSEHLGEVYVIENHQGVVDTRFRAYYMTLDQVEKEFGRENMPEGWVRQLDNPDHLTTEKELLHVVRPRKNFSPLRVDAKGMPFESVHIALEQKVVMRESGYRSFPMAMSRYTQHTNETYGRGPAQTVLPAIKVLNEEKKTVIKQGHRIVDPVLLTYDDGQVGTFSLRPGAINPGGVSAQGRPLVHTLPTGNPIIGKDLMDDERAVINDAFLITLFQILVETPTMTATEVLERAREKGLLIAPTAGRYQQEYLGPMILRELDVLDQLGQLPPPPQVLLDSGAGFKIEYDNPLARMVRAENAAGFMRSLDSALNIVQITQDPSPLDWFDFDEAMPAIQDISGAPTAWTRTADQVAAIRGKREQERQEQRMVEAAPSVAALAKVEADNRNR